MTYGWKKIQDIGRLKTDPGKKFSKKSKKKPPKNLNF